MDTRLSVLSTGVSGMKAGVLRNGDRLGAEGRVGLRRCWRSDVSAVCENAGLLSGLSICTASLGGMGHALLPEGVSFDERAVCRTPGVWP